MNARLTIGSIGVWILCVAVCFGQGSLSPSAGPAPTMKTLDQVESRTPISSLPFIIDQPGSYYVTTNLTGSLVSVGVTIATNDVTLDLNGFTLRSGLLSREGILVSGARKNICIRNGVIRNWPLYGVDAGAAENSLLEGLRVSGNGWGGTNKGGIRIGSDSVVRRCVLAGNKYRGIHALEGCVVSDCTANENGQGPADVGFDVGPGSVVQRCTARLNHSAGIFLREGGRASECTASDNAGTGIITLGRVTVNQCTADRNLDDGIYVGTGCVVSGCASSYNGGNGIRAYGGCRIVDNHCYSNVGAGILLVDSRNVVDHNSVSFNDLGIDVDYSVNLVLRNSARGNTSGNYDIVAGNRVATIVVPPVSGAISGNGPGAGSGATDPFANFAF